MEPTALWEGFGGSCLPWFVSASVEQLVLGSGRVLWWGDVGIGPRLSWLEFAVFVICGILVWSEPVEESTAPLPGKMDVYWSS